MEKVLKSVITGKKHGNVNMPSLNFDLHIHSHHSSDSTALMEEMCASAVKKNIKAIAFTDHFDTNEIKNGQSYFNYDDFSQEIDGMREKFNGRLTILKGIEFGEPHRYPYEFDIIIKKDFDIILGSIHCIQEIFVGDKSLQDIYIIKDIYENYYSEVLKAVNFGGFDALAHIDFPKRYLKPVYDDSLLIDQILYQMIKKGIALEINSSPLRKGINETCPDDSILKKYLKAGGYKITTGSDAHTAKDVACDFDYVKNLLIKNGIEKVGIIKNRKYEEVKI